MFKSVSGLQSLNSMNAMPAFWPTPMNENPAIVNSESTFFFSKPRKCSSTRLATSSVRPCDAPEGSVQITMPMPWSS